MVRKISIECVVVCILEICYNVTQNRVFNYIKKPIIKVYNGHCIILSLITAFICSTLNILNILSVLSKMQNYTLMDTANHVTFIIRTAYEGILFIQPTLNTTIIHNYTISMVIQVIIWSLYVIALYKAFSYQLSIRLNYAI
jgi:hypothetical protein